MLAACTQPLRGIVHVAGITDDAMVANQTVERFARIMAAKVQGAWNLHQHTKQLPLDFFVNYSSDSSFLGYASQTPYSAANAFLDGLSHHRRAQGLPGLTINWGPWGEVGISSRVTEKYQRRMMQHGRYFLPVRLALQAIAQVINQPLAQIAVLPIDWQRWAETLPLAQPWPFMAQIVQPDTNTHVIAQAECATSSTTAQQVIQAAPLAERHTVLENYLRRVVGQVLGTTSSTLGRQQGFFDYGLDSLTSIELRNQMQVDLAVTLPQMVAFTYASIAALSGYLITEVLDIEFENDAESIAKESTETQILTDQVNQQTDAEAEDELMQTLAELNL